MTLRIAIWPHVHYVFVGLLIQVKDSSRSDHRAVMDRLVPRHGGTGSLRGLHLYVFSCRYVYCS